MNQDTTNTNLFRYNDVKVIFHHLTKLFHQVPFSIFCLSIYMALTSTMIFSTTGIEIVPWHHAYPGWYDGFLLGTLGINFVIGHLKISKQTFVFLSMLFSIILLSLVGYTGDWQAIMDAMLYFLRFALPFAFTVYLVNRYGVEPVESLITLLFAILAVTALFVASLQFGTFNRIYSSAMTVAGFSQVTVVVVFLAILRKYFFVTFISIGFLILTFSRTSIISFMLLYLVYLLRSGEKKQIFYLTLLALIAVEILSEFVFQNWIGFENIFDNLFEQREIETLHGRTELWTYASEVWHSGTIPIFGVGFNVAPSLLMDFSFEILPGVFYSPPSFHSFFIEYSFSLGFLSSIIFYYLFKRIWQTFRQNIYPAFFIFSVFVITQSADFTFYRPKEVIIWAVILGLAEGQFRTHWKQEKHYSYHHFE